MREHTQASIVVVDDEAENLTLLHELLHHKGHAVRCFLRGTPALEATAAEPADLILLDVSMPDMDGFEVCRRLKANTTLASIPVIFLSALTETRQKVRAFQSGAADYITKPFQADEVFARVETQLGLRRARQAERELLEQTLNGALGMLVGLVHLAGPALSERADNVSRIVAHLASRLDVDEPWECKLAATLCLLGCIAVPPDAFERAYHGDAVPASEAEMFRAHPATGAGLVASIPRLARVAEMIRRQQMDNAPAEPGDAIELGARMLRIALDLDRRMLTGLAFETALAQIRARPGRHAMQMIAALVDFAPPRMAAQRRRVKVHELRPSMIVEEPVTTEEGKLVILPKHTRLSMMMIERVRNFAKTRGICEPIHVRVAAPESEHELA